MSGKKDFLPNLIELHSIFKSEYPTRQIGSSTFCSLRSKMCVLPGLSVTHSVCVCTHHQNMILILALLGVSLAELNEFRVCDIISKRVYGS